MTVERLMTRDVQACTANETLNVPADIMWNNHCGGVPVVSADGRRRIVGIVTGRDIAMAAYTQGKLLWQIPVSAAMAVEVLTCKPRDRLSRVQRLMQINGLRQLPVVDQSGRLVGMFLDSRRCAGGSISTASRSRKSPSRRREDPRRDCERNLNAPTAERSPHVAPEIASDGALATICPRSLVH